MDRQMMFEYDPEYLHYATIRAQSVNGLHLDHYHTDHGTPLWRVMWFDQVLFTCNDERMAQTYLDDLILNDNDDAPAKENK